MTDSTITLRRALLALVAVAAAVLLLHAPTAPTVSPDGVAPPPLEGQLPAASVAARAPATTTVAPTLRAPEAPAGQVAASPRVLGVEALGPEGHGRSVIAGEVVVSATPRTQAELAERLEAAGFSILEYSSAIGAMRVALPAGQSVAEGLVAVAAVPGARPVPNALAWAIDAAAANVESNGEALIPWTPSAADWEAAAIQEGMEASEAGAARAALADANANALGYPVVAVIDTGVAYRSAAHRRGPFLKMPNFATVAFGEGWNFVHDDSDPLDDNAHGTHMTSVLLEAAGYGARVLPIKVLDWQALGSEFDVAQGIAYAVESEAHIINLSLTFGVGYVPSPMMLDALDRAMEAEIIVVGGAGNSGASSVAHPAAFDSVIAVGALQGPEAVAPYSNYGGALDLVAPGGGLPEAQHGIIAQSFWPLQPTRLERFPMSGTSVSAAHLSGTLASMVRTAGLSETAAVAHAALTSPRRLSPNVFDPLWGLGALDVEHALRSVQAARAPAGKDERDVVDRPTAYPMVLIEQVDARQVRGVAIIELMDRSGAPLQHAMVYGDWTGSAPGSAECFTDDFGRCVVETDAVDPAGESALFGLTVHRVVPDRGTPMRVRPGSRVDPIGGDDLTDAMLDLELVATAENLSKDDLDVLGEVDPITGQPLYCLGRACPGAVPQGAGDGDLYRITYSPMMVISHTGSHQPGESSLLDGRHIAESFAVRSLGPGYEGSGLTIAFDRAFKDALVEQVGAEHVYLDTDGLRLTTDGEGETLLWVNDMVADELANGVGMMISGMRTVDFVAPEIQAPLSLWAAESFYTPSASGVGMMISGMMVGVIDAQTFWTVNEWQHGNDWDSFGVGMMISGMSPSPYFNLPYFNPPLPELPELPGVDDPRR